MLIIIHCHYMKVDELVLINLHLFYLWYEKKSMWY